MLLARITVVLLSGGPVVCARNVVKSNYPGFFSITSSGRGGWEGREGRGEGGSREGMYRKRGGRQEQGKKALDD